MTRRSTAEILERAGALQHVAGLLGDRVEEERDPARPAPACDDPGMIRNVVVGRLKDGVRPEEIEPALQALRDLTVEGVEFTLVAGVDRGLREGNASYALTCDLVDDDAYRIYDADPEHNRIRREMFAPLSVVVERVQFLLPEGAP